MSMENKDLYLFGDYSLNIKEGNLWLGDRHIALPPKVFDTLKILVERSGEVVTKDEILSTVWPDTFVEESNLSQNIYTLRQIFGKENKFIETVPRRGYRFALPVERVATSTAEIPKEKPERSTHEHIAEAALSSRKFKPATLAAFGALAVAAVFMVVGAVWYRSENVTPTAFSKTVELRSLTDSGSSQTPTISPDGKFVAYVDVGGDKPSMRLMDIASGSNVEIKIEGGHAPGLVAFSHDGTSLFFRARGPARAGRKIFKMPYFGGYPLPMAENAWGGFAVSPNGRYLAYFRHDPASGSDQLIKIDLATGEESVISSLSVPEQFFMIVPPTWSPDSSQIAVLKRETGPKRSTIYAVDVKSGDERAIVTDLEKIFHISWTRDGDSLYALSKEPEKGRQLWQVNAHTGSTSRVTNDLQFYEGLSISSKGDLLVSEVIDVSSNIWLYRKADPSGGIALTSGSYGQNGIVNLAYATTGRVVFDTRAKVNRELWSIEIDGLAKTRLLEATGPRNTQITTSADGMYVYYSSTDAGSSGIWRVGQDGSDPTRITTTDENEMHVFPQISNDQAALYFVAQTRGKGEIRSIDLKTLETSTVYTADNLSLLHFLEISPDDSYLAFAFDNAAKSTVPETLDIEQQAPAGVKIGVIKIANGGEMQQFELKSTRPFVKFTNGGGSVDYVLNDSIKRADLANFNAEHKTVFNVSGERIFNFDWSMDGADLTVAKGGSAGDIVFIKIGD